MFLRDGATFSGSVVKTSPGEITVVGDDQSTRTFPMQNVESIEYGDAGEPLAGSSAGRDERREERAHESHYHPEVSSIRTRIYEVPAGTELAVRTQETIDSGRVESASEGRPI